MTMSAAQAQRGIIAQRLDLVSRAHPASRLPQQRAKTDNAQSIDRQSE